MDLTENDRPKVQFEVVEPNTNRVQELKRLKEEKEREQALLEEKKRKQQEEEERKKWTLAKLKEEEKAAEYKKRMEEERRRREEEEQSNTLSGRFGHMINDLNTNCTNLEFTTSGMDLRPAQIKVLISNVQANSSLKGLTMCRKKLTDVQGKEISENLSSNEFLQRLELEGNQLTSKTLKAIAKLLRTNETIRHIDLEGNDLVKGDGDKPDHEGIDELAEALKMNETLLSLNLNSTGLNEHASQQLLKVMEVNNTLIIIDVENNPRMNINDVIEIQNKLILNKQSYDNERYKEFIERKRTRREEDISGVLLLNQQTKKLRTEAIQLNIKTKKAQLDEEWDEFVRSQQLQRQKDIIRMEKQASMKKSKKKK